MELLKKIKRSVYDPGYYADLLVEPFWYSIKYYFSFITILALLLTLLLSLCFIPRVALFVNVAGTKIVQHYPAELKITIDKGKVSTNVQEPYVIDMPAE